MLNTFIESILGFLFPDRCAGCGKLGTLLCAPCCAKLEPFPYDKTRIPGLDRTAVAFVFGGALRPAIHQLKYRKRRHMATLLGDLMADHMSAEGLTADALIPVPLHASRQRERGFNQSELLAQRVAADSHLPLLTAGLVRVRATEQQARLNAVSRRTNMRNAFVWQSPTPPPAQVILIDDVLTTGSTIVACADALRAAGSREVYALALARSRPGE